MRKFITSVVVSVVAVAVVSIFAAAAEAQCARGPLRRAGNRIQQRREARQNGDGFRLRNVLPRNWGSN